MAFITPASFWLPGEAEAFDLEIGDIDRQIGDLGIGTGTDGNIVATGGQAKEAETTKNFDSAAADKSALQRTGVQMDEMVRRGLFQSSVKDTELFDIEAAKALRKQFLETNFKTTLSGLGRAKSGLGSKRAGVANNKITAGARNAMNATYEVPDAPAPDAPAAPDAPSGASAPARRSSGGKDRYLDASGSPKSGYHTSLVNGFAYIVNTSTGNRVARY